MDAWREREGKREGEEGGGGRGGGGGGFRRDEMMFLGMGLGCFRVIGMI